MKNVPGSCVIARISLVSAVVSFVISAVIAALYLEYPIWMSRRAFVGIGGSGLTFSAQKNGIRSVDVTLDNSGEIPAEDVHLRIKAAPGPHDGFDFRPLLLGAQDVRNLGQIEPKQQGKVRLDLKYLTRDDITRIHRGNETLFVFGCLGYEDGFGQGRCPTPFCYRLDPKLPTGFAESCAIANEDGRKYCGQYCQEERSRWPKLWGSPAHSKLDDQ